MLPLDHSHEKERFVNRVLRVVIVDDSAYVRKVIREMLSRSPFIDVVGTAHDGEEALEMVEELQPDVITLDLNMARMDGLAFLRAQQARRPTPVVVVSIANDTSEQVLDALENGAIDFVQKPTALANDRMLEIGNELIEKVKAAAAIPQMQVPPVPTGVPAPPAVEARGFRPVDIVVIGVSTVGPQALKALIPRLPADFPIPIAIVLHMPLGYTAAFAQRLDDASQLTVREAQEGDPLVPGRVLLARAGQHLTFRRAPDGSVVAHLDRRPLDLPHRPAVDVLFQSAAEVFGERVLGIVMTGMGSDGQQGAAWIKAQGGTIWTESEESCIVYGMPRSVVEAMLSDRSLALGEVAPALTGVGSWQRS